VIPKATRNNILQIFLNKFIFVFKMEDNLRKITNPTSIQLKSPLDLIPIAEISTSDAVNIYK